MSDLATLTLRIDKKGVTLVLTGPKTKVGPASIAPSVGVRRGPQGSYHFVVGNKTKVIAPSKLPSQIRQALRSLGGSGAANAPFRSGLPAPKQIQDPFGAYVSHEEYMNRRLSQSIGGVLWPNLSKDEYTSLVELYVLVFSTKVKV